MKIQSVDCKYLEKEKTDWVNYLGWAADPARKSKFIQSCEVLSAIRCYLLNRNQQKNISAAIPLQLALVEKVDTGEQDRQPSISGKDGRGDNGD